LNLLPTRFAAIGLILGAFALFAAEAKFASHGVLTIGGIALLTLGGLLLVDSPIPEMRVHLLTALAISIPLGLITAFLMSIALKARRNKMVSGAQGLIGETGIAQDPLSPRRQDIRPRRTLGRGLLLRSAAGQSVVVRRVDGLVLQSGAVCGRRHSCPPDLDIETLTASKASPSRASNPASSEFRAPRPPRRYNPR
jgi:membrane-bound serine protease (ClpP class)